MSEQVDDNQQGGGGRRRKRGVVGHVVRRGIPLIVLALVVAGAYLYWRRSDGAPKPVTAAAPQGPVPVEVVTVRKETVAMPLRFLGQTESSQTVEIRARVAGHLLERTFREGERVEKGQKLFQIDPRPFEVELRETKARLASSEARLDRARQQLKRYEELSARQSATQGELEEWQKEERVAAAEVALQKAQIAAAELQLTYASIESPITGMIGRALKDAGSYVDAGQNGLVAVVQQVDPMYVRYAVTEHEMLRFRRQQAAGQVVSPERDQIELEVTLADGTTYPHRGHVSFVDVQVDQTTGTTVVRGTLPNPDGVLRPGQFVYANVLGIQRLDVTRVPQSCVMQSPAGAWVMVVNEKDVVESRPVTLGEWSGKGHWIVEAGLAPGDRVVASRLMMVRPGTPVTVSPAAPAAAADAPAGPATVAARAPVGQSKPVNAKAGEGK